MTYSSFTVKPMLSMSTAPPKINFRNPKVFHTAILGNVCVGKTSIFEALCTRGERSVNIPQSTMKVDRGVVTVGAFGAPRSLQRKCSSCSVSKISHDKLHREESVNIFECPGASSLKTDSTIAILHLYDTPGSQTLAANGEDEMVARDLLLSGAIDSLLVVIDAKNIRRSLAFFLEAREFGLPIVAALNMVDESEDMGVDIDEQALSKELGISVVSTVAVEKRGIRKLADTVPDAKVPNIKAKFPEDIETAVSEIEKLISTAFSSSRGLAVLLLSSDTAARKIAEKILSKEKLEAIDNILKGLNSTYRTPLKDLLQEIYHEEARKIVNRVAVTSPSGPNMLVRFGSLSQKPITGMLIAALVMIAAYYWVGVLGAGIVVDSIMEVLLNGYLMPLAESIFLYIPSEFVRDALINEDFGIISSGIFLALGIVLPVLFFFYLFQALLEDSGYLPRLAVLFDRVFRKLGLSGHSLIPLLLGFSCVTMAVITTRILPTKRERIILTLLLILGVPCAPLLSVMLVILQPMPFTAFLAVFGTIVSQILLAGYLSSKVLKGDEPDLIMELPKMRIPRIRIIIRKTWRRSFLFIKEALPIFIIASFVVFLFDRVGGLRTVEQIAKPFIHGVLGLPDDFVQVLIKTAIRRENGAAELLHAKANFDNVQMVVTMLVMTFLMPCLNATIVIFKERGIATSTAILAIAASWAVVVGAVFNYVCRTFGITFT